MVTTEGKTVSKGARTLACEGPVSVAIPRPCWWHWARSPLCECVPGLHVLLSIGVTLAERACWVVLQATAATAAQGTWCPRVLDLSIAALC